MSEQTASDRYDYLIVGGGMVAASAAQGIRERDADGTIGIVGEEPTAPFPRPALSKKLWLDDEFDVEDGALHTAEETGADLLLSRRVTEVDPQAHRVSFTTAGPGGTEGALGYGRLLLATGGHPRRIEGLEPGERVFYFRTLSDYRALRMLATDGPHVTVVGGGYIGTEIAAALVQNGCRVTLLHPDDVLGGPTFPPSLARRIEGAFTEAGVEVRGGAKVARGEQSGDGVRLHLEEGDPVEADVVVVGLGIEPAAGYLPDAVARSEDGGVAVDAHLATNVDDVWAAGDVAEYPDVILGRRRVEHVDNAQTMGAAAGRILAGSDEAYDHTPMFYSDLFDHWYEAVGTLDASLTTVEDPPAGPDGDALVVYYLDPEKDDEVVGVLLWDCDGGLDAARELLARHPRPADPSELLGSVR